MHVAGGEDVVPVSLHKAILGFWHLLEGEEFFPHDAELRPIKGRSLGTPADARAEFLSSGAG